MTCMPACTCCFLLLSPLVPPYFDPTCLPARLPAWRAGRKLRCVGSGLSPNGIAFSEDGMVSLALLDKVLHIDREKGQVGTAAAAAVSAVCAVRAVT